MLKSVAEMIETIYKDGNTEIFISGCRKKLEIMDGLIQQIADGSVKIQKIPSENEPAAEILIQYPPFQRQEFCVNYSSILKINKLVDVYYLQHEFSVENIDPDRIDAALDGFGNAPYCRKQFKTEELIDAFLSQQHYDRLYLCDMEEVIPEIQMPENSIAGPQMTVENALFRDLMCFLADE